MVETAVDVQDLKPGQHAYVAFSSDPEQAHVLADFVRSGLERNERVLYFSYGKEPAEVAAQLRRRNIDTDRLLAANHLVLQAAYGTYLSNGRFDAAETKSKWFAAIAETIAGGFNVMRVAADMSWAVDDISGSDQLPAYETAIAEVFATRRVIGLCEFDRRVIPPKMLDELAQLHRHEVRVHAVHTKDRLEVRLVADPPGATISGEIDVYNHVDLENALEILRTILDDDVYLDLSGLRFIDAHGLGAIVRWARRLEPDRVVLHGVHPYIYKILGLCGWTDIPNLIISTKSPAYT